MLPLQAHILPVITEPGIEVPISEVEILNLPPSVDHELAGRGIAGIIFIPSARGQKLAITDEHDFIKLAQTGNL